MRNLQELPKFGDGLSYLYVEHARIDQEQKSISWISQEGRVAVPAAALGVLLLGPGTVITHAAVKALADNGCSICWVGEGAVRLYATGLGETRSARNLSRQAAAWADPDERTRVVRQLYAMRFTEPPPPDLSLQQLRGLEGVRVRDAYAQASRAFGVPWTGRSYRRGEWAAADPVNRALSAGTACLYGVCHAGIVSSGYSPALGFIHTGKMLSFVYDVADLYKIALVVPVAFSVVADGSERVESRVRAQLRAQIKAKSLLERVVTDLHRLFRGREDEEFDDEGGGGPGALWDPEGAVSGGVSYGGDGA